MFENKLKQDLQDIFGVKKASYDEPGSMKEQECLFVAIDDAKCKVTDGTIRARVEGSATMFAVAEKLPFGFYTKAISKAPSNLTKNFFFHDLEGNTKTFKNLVQRSFSFVYFFDSQYDPNLGSITDINIIEETP